MIKETEIEIRGHSRNLKHYRDIGYDISIGDIVYVKPHHLMKGSSVKVTCICDNCKSERPNTFKDYYLYTNGLSEEFYCIKCKGIKSEITSISNWGTKNPMQNDLVKAKLKDSIIKSYDVDHYSKTDEYKEKFKKTCVEKYGVDNPFKSNDVKNIIKNKIQEKFGVDYPMQSESVKEKAKISNINKFGKESYSKTDEYKLKIKNTSLKNWGVDNPMQSSIIKDKITNKNLVKYGHSSYLKTDEFKIKLKSNRQIKTHKRFIEILGDNYHIISYSDELFEIEHKKCNSKFNIYKGLVRARKNLNIEICTNCNPIGVQYSSIELEVRDFLKNNNIEYKSGERSVLSGKELDIFIPSYNLAIEVNGLFWHSEFYKDKNYHLNKTEACRDSGIRLLHIWEDDWKNKNKIIKSIILNSINKIESKIYSRNCYIKEVGSKEAREFLNNNHIQGFSSSQIKIGLYYKDELVSLMTFGWRYTNSKREYELIRFCNKINVSVIGSASKLFNYFKNNYEFTEIISYADISLFSGVVYEKIGFEKISLSEPNYYWVINNMRHHRFNFSKKKLVKQGFDINKTEVEIMHQRGSYRVFSCGQEKWVFKKRD